MSSRRSTPLVVALLVHVALDASLLALPWQFSDEIMLFVVVALPISQNALVALLASTHPSPSYVRCVVLSIGLVATWYVAASVMPYRVSSEMAAAWGTAFVVQSLVIVLIVGAVRLLARRRAACSDSTRAPAARGYSLATMLLWVAALTVPLMLIRLSVTQLGWTTRIFQWEFFPHLAVVGAYNGLYAILVFLSIVGRGSFLRCLGAVCLLVGLSATEVPVLDWAFAGAGVEFETAMLFAGAQVLILYATLVPLRLAAGQAATQHEPRAPASTPTMPVSAQEVKVRV